MEMKYTLVSKGKLMEIELASLFEDKSLIGDVQIQYYTNGIKTFARIERVRVLDEYQNNDKHYGSFMMNEVVQHISEYEPSFDTSVLKNRLASNAENIDGRLDAASKRGIDRIHLECDSKLERFYSRSGFKKNDDLVMKIDLHKPGYSSLE